jgi:hypothetical protein
MDNPIYVLWFSKEMPPGEEDIELLIGVYSSEQAAQAAIQRVNNQRGFADCPQGFEISAYELNRDHWPEGFSVEGASSEE